MTKNTFLLRSALVAALAGLLFGFDTAVISALKELYSSFGSEWFLARTDHRQRADWDDRRGDYCRQAGGSLGAACDPVSDRRSLLCLGGRQRPGVGLVFVSLLPVPGWNWGGGSLGGVADVHRRDLPRPCAAAW